MIANEELDFPESERCGGCVGAALALLSRSQQEEECDPGEVGDGLLAVSATLCVGVQGVENVDR